jgi:uncharacterized protein (DUF58 family)
MAFVSKLSQESKLERALVVTLALADVLVQGGERVGVPGVMAPTASRNVIDKIAQALTLDTGERASLPPAFSPAPLSEVLLLSDLWSPMAEIRTALAQLSTTGANGHVVQVIDPAEETFPYSGRIEFVEPEGAGAITAGRAEAWRSDYERRVDLHRSEIRAQTDRCGWTFIVHRTDRPSSDLLLQLHARLSAGSAAFGADRRRGTLARSA